MTQKKSGLAQDHTRTGVSEDTILKVTKEIAVKFIEVGRLTPSTFDETFKQIHQTITDTVLHDR